MSAGRAVGLQNAALPLSPTTLTVGLPPAPSARRQAAEPTPTEQQKAEQQQQAAKGPAATEAAGAAPRRLTERLALIGTLQTGVAATRKGRPRNGP